MALYLGVDIGSSTIKGTVIDENGEIVKQARVSSRITNPRPGFYEVEPVEVWWKGFLGICDILRQEVDFSQVRSICVSSVCGSFVPVDERLDPVHNAILYGIDTRSSKQVDTLNRRYPKEKLNEVLGGTFTSHSIIPKLLWLKEEKPDVYGNAWAFLESCNFVTARLTGETAWDYPTASGALLVDLTTLSQPAFLLEDLAIDPKKIPPFKWPLQVLGRVSEDAASLTGLNIGMPVVTGACDINAEALACGAVSPGDMVVVYGSTISILLVVDRIIQLEGFVTGASFTEGSYRLGGATSSGGRLLEWVDRLLSARTRTATPVPETPTQILMLPYLDGARLPFHDPDAKAVWFGMTRSTTREEICISARESFGFELSIILKKLDEVFPVPDCLHVMGGLSNDIGLMQIVSNITGKSQRTFPALDASYGDALAAMTVDLDLEDITCLESVIHSRERGSIIEPDRILYEQYASLVEKFEALYKSTHGLY